MRKKELRRVRVAIAYLGRADDHLNFLLYESKRPFKVKRVKFTAGSALTMVRSARTLLQNTVKVK